MNNRPPYLVDDIKDEKTISPELLDALKFELDQRIYYYGAQFKFPKEQHGLFEVIKQYQKNLMLLLKKQIWQLLKKQRPQRNLSGKKVLSNAYISLNKHLSPLGFDVRSPLWGPIADPPTRLSKEISKEVIFLSKIMNNAPFNQILSNTIIGRIEKFRSTLLKFFVDQKIAALIVPNDMSFFFNLAISVCKEAHIPTFIFLHGLPGGYNSIDDNRADYLLVWGEAIKNNHIKYGMKPEKIYVTGHPLYNRQPPSDLRFGLESILVLTKAMNGAQFSDAVRLSDRGNLVLYLRSVARVLRRFGVTSVRLRPHPSESSDWYQQFIDNSFYEIDSLALSQSLERSSLVIGPESTVMLDAIFSGVNYLMYEPTVTGLDIINYPLMPPFDGSVAGLPVASDEDELFQFLRNKKKVDTGFIRDYVKVPFDISFLKELI